MYLCVEVREHLLELFPYIPHTGSGGPLGHQAWQPGLLISYFLNKFNVMVKFHLKQNNPNKFMCNNFQWFFSMTKCIIIHKMHNLFHLIL